MTIAPETAMVRLRRLFRDANHCSPHSNEQAFNWALKPEIWAEQQVRFRNWSWLAAEATVRHCRILTNLIVRAAQKQGLTAEALVAGFPFPASPELEPEA